MTAPCLEWVSQSLKAGGLLGRTGSWEGGGGGASLPPLCIFVRSLTPPTNTFGAPTTCRVLGAGGTAVSETIPASSGVWERAVRLHLSGNVVKGGKQTMEMWGGPGAR